MGGWSARQLVCRALGLMAGWAADQILHLTKLHITECLKYLLISYSPYNITLIEKLNIWIFTGFFFSLGGEGGAHITPLHALQHYNLIHIIIYNIRYWRHAPYLEL